MERLGILQVKDISLRFELDHHSRAYSLGRERVAKKLTPRQLEEGMKAAAEWKPKEKECCPQ